MKNIKLLIASSLILTSTFAFAQSTTTGFDITKCTKCHSDESINRQIEFPRLESQPVEYIQNAMKAYKADKRHNFSAVRYMERRLDNLKLSQKTIDEVAVYFSKLPMKKLDIVSDAQQVAAGKTIYANSCAMCHGDNAEGIATSPRLAGQYKSFLITQLKAYQAGKILDQNDMSELAKTLSDSDVESVST